jgi:hypothetical protein
MAANAIPTPELKVVVKKTVDENQNEANESSAPVALKQRLAKLLHEVFEGHEEYLGVTPD